MENQTSKKLLILQACGIKGEELEISNIRNQAILHNIAVDQYCPKTNDQLEDIMLQLQEFSYDYVYLSSHGNDEGFGNDEQTIQVSWRQFGILLCESGSMKKDCIVMLSCCRGGLTQVAYQLFYQCPNISYVVGPRQSLPVSEMVTCFVLFLFNIEHRGVDPLVACEKFKNGTDTRFVCFDIMETQGDFGFIEFEKEQTLLEETEARAEERVREAESVLEKLGAPSTDIFGKE